MSLSVSVGARAQTAVATATPAPILIDPQVKAELEAVKAPYVPVKGVPGGAATMLGMNFFGMATVAGVLVTKAVIAEKRASGQSLTVKEEAEIAGEVATQLVGNGGVWSALGAAALTKQVNGKVIKPALDALPAKAGFVKSLGGAIAGSLSLPAMAGASHLWEHSVNKLPPEEKERGQNFIRALVDTVGKPGLKGKAEEAKAQGLAFKHIVENAGHIAFVNPDDRDLWLYDTWRNGIMNGKSMTLLGGMQAGGEIGAVVGSAVPIVGTVLGGAAGGAIGGGLAAGLVPESVQEAMTKKLSQFRRDRLENKLDRCMQQARLGFRTLEPTTYSATDDVPLNPAATRLLDKCQAVREGQVTLELDGLKRAAMVYFIADKRAKAAAGLNRADEENKQRQQMVEAAHEISKARARILTLYADQETKFKSMWKEIANAPNRTMVRQEALRVHQIARKMNDLLQRVPDQDEATGLMFQFADKGFVENSLLNAPGEADEKPMLAGSVPNDPNVTQ